MDLNVLNKISTEGLKKMQAHIEAVLASRLDTTLRIGRLATFEDSREGTTRTIVIERINGKSVSGVETGSSVKPGMKWRVSKTLLKVVPTERRTPVTAPRAATPHRPATSANTW